MYSATVLYPVPNQPPHFLNTSIGSIGIIKFGYAIMNYSWGEGATHEFHNRMHRSWGALVA